MDVSTYLEPAALVTFAIAACKAIAIIFIGYMIAGWAQGAVTRGFERGKVDVALSRFLGQTIRYIVIFATFIAAADSIGFDTAALIAVFASAGLAVGLALQGSLAHFASGVMILFFRPFTIGDVITGAGHTGQVLEIGLFATELMKHDGTKVIVPSGALTGGTIENHTVLNKRRGTISIGVAYGVDLDLVQTILERACGAVPQVLADPGPAVVFTGFGASSLDWQIHVWSSPGDFLLVQEAVRRSVYAELNAAGVSIPYNVLDVNLISQAG